MSELVLQLENAGIKREEKITAENINFTLKAGEFVYLTGKIGSGKTSLIKTLYGELPLYAGRAVVAGFDLSVLKKEDVPFLRRKLGIIFQDYKLLKDRNVFENIKFAKEAGGESNPKVVREAVNRRLEETGLTDKAKKMPYELSGGEQQLAVAARALVNNPVLILADEPTGNLDESSANKLMRLLEHEAEQGVAVLMATHHLALTEKYLHRVIQLS